LSQRAFREFFGGLDPDSVQSVMAGVQRMALLLRKSTDEKVPSTEEKAYWEGPFKHYAKGFDRATERIMNFRQTMGGSKLSTPVPDGKTADEIADELERLSKANLSEAPNYKLIHGNVFWSDTSNSKLNAATALELVKALQKLNQAFCSLNAGPSDFALFCDADQKRESADSTADPGVAGAMKYMTKHGITRYRVLSTENESTVSFSILSGALGSSEPQASSAVPVAAVTATENGDHKGSVDASDASHVSPSPDNRGPPPPPNQLQIPAEPVSVSDSTAGAVPVDHKVDVTGAVSKDDVDFL